MEFKIDTRATYTHITPIYGHLNAIMAAALGQKCTQLSETGSQNFLIDLNNCQDADKDAFTALGQLHETCYAAGQSLVFTGIQDAVMRVIKEEEADLILNIAPKEIEAIDIISMEILERDLFNEEG
jgi:anti-anti-sigma regulatory factor